MQDQEQNPYSPPSTNSINTQVAQTGRKRTIEEAIAYDYDFDIKDIISKAWAQVEGKKLTFLFGLLVIAAFNIITGIILNFLPSGVGHALNIVFTAVSSCISAGLMVIALKYLRDESVDFKQDFLSVLNIFTVLFIASLLVNLLTIVGLILLVIPGIFLAVAYVLTMWIIVDNPGVSAWQAMEASRKIITKKWLKVFLLYLALGLIIIISAIPLGIGLFWTIPLAMLSMGTLYRTIFEE